MWGAGRGREVEVGGSVVLVTLLGGERKRGRI